MAITVKDLATVQMGYSFRSRLKAVEGGSVSVIQMKDLDDDTVRCVDWVAVELDGMKEHHFAKKDDLIFRSRGQITTSAILLADPGKAVVAAPLLRIRVTNPDVVLPEYLNWYINQRDAQILLARQAKGSAQQMISKRALENLEVALPCLKKQKRIVELAALSTREQELLHALADKRARYVSAVLMQYATTGREEVWNHRTY